MAMDNYPKQVTFLSCGCEAKYIQMEDLRNDKGKIVNSGNAIYEYTSVPKRSDKKGKTIVLSLQHLSRLDSFGLIDFKN